MPLVTANWDLTEAGVQVCVQGETYDWEQDYIDWLNRNSPGVLSPAKASAKAAPQNRMATGSPQDRGPRLAETFVEEEDDEEGVGPDQVGDNEGDDWNLVAIDATPGATNLANKTGFNLKTLAGKGSGAGGRIIKKDVEEALKELS